MNRRKFGEMVVATTVSLGGVSSVASAQETDPLRGEDVSMNLGSAALSFGRAELTFDDGRMRFRGQDWTLEGPANTFTGDRLQVVVDEVSAETFATVRSALADAADSHSTVPLFIGLAQADIDSDAAVGVSASGVAQDDRGIADRITAVGRFDEVVPDDLDTVSRESLLTGRADVGPSEWEKITVNRDDTELVFSDVEVTPVPRDEDQDVSETRFNLEFGEITRDGEQLVSDFETTGTLAELLAALPTAEAPDDQRLPQEVIVSSPDTDERMDYVFEVTGDLEKLEPDEDAGPAIDDVIRSGDRVRVEGTVGSGDDRFAFSGELIEVDIPDEVELEIRDR